MTDQELKDLVASIAVDIKEIAKMQAETDRRMQETDLKMKETDRQMQETDRKLKDIGVQLGGIGNNSGYHAEQFFQDVFENKKEFGGIKYDEMVPNFGIKDSKRKMEIDIVLINGDSVALIETKNRVHPDFVEEFAEKRVEKFRTFFPEYRNYKIYLGIAGFSFDDEVLIKAKESGIGIVKQVGEGVEVEAESLKAY